MSESEQNKAKNLVEKMTEEQVRVSLEARLARSLFWGFVIFSLSMVFSEIALATAKFDIGAGVEGGTKPLIDAVKAHWGKGVAVTGVAAALIGEGDPRQRAIRAGIGCFASGGVVLALMAMFT